MDLCAKGLHELDDLNLIIEYEKSRSKINKRCRACKNEYERFRKRFNRTFPGQPLPKLWFLFQFPKYKKCKKNKHLMTPRNTRLVGKDKDKRCNKCYKDYRRKYQKKWQLYKLYK